MHTPLRALQLRWGGSAMSRTALAALQSTSASINCSPRASPSSRPALRPAGAAAGAASASASLGCSRRGVRPGLIAADAGRLRHRRRLHCSAQASDAPSALPVAAVQIANTAGGSSPLAKELQPLAQGINAAPPLLEAVEESSAPNGAGVQLLSMPSTPPAAASGVCMRMWREA